jgi:hypothetical protein
VRALLRAVCAAAVLSAPSGAEAGTDPEGLACLAPPFEAPASEREREVQALVGWLRTALAPFGGLGGVLADEPPEFCLAAHLFGAQGYVDATARRVVLRADLPPGLMRAVAIHELRHVEQVRRGTCPSEGLSMQATGRVVMAMEADASAVSLAVAWSLREAGDGAVWAALADWPTHTKLARAFEAEMRGNGDVARATAAAFAAWYEDAALVERTYVAACSGYLDRQDESHALPRYGALDGGLFDDLCRLPGGEGYPCSEPEVARR